MRATSLGAIAVLLLLAGGARAEDVADSATGLTAATAAQIEPRLLAQQGLAPDLALNLVQTAEQVLIDSADTDTTCEVLTGGSSIKQVKHTVVSPTVTKVAADFYYDSACRKPYIEATATVTHTTTGFSFSGTETASYLTRAGGKLGTLVLTESLAVNAKQTELTFVGAGHFAPAGGAQVVSLGLVCISPLASAKVVTIPCTIGLAQTLPKLAVSIASLTTIGFTSTEQGTKVSFKDTASKLATGGVGALKITASGTTLGIGGKSTSFGTTVLAGTAGHYGIFPPPPTQWTLTDKTHATLFAIDVTLNSASSLAGTITSTTTNKKLATLKLDRAGIGTIGYTGGATVPVSNFLISE